MTATTISPADSQVPAPGSLALDHVAHFVPHINQASSALKRLGFTLTPFSAQSHRLEPGGPLIPAGTGNRCVMLQRGYLEFLTPTGSSPLAEQLRAAIQRYVGVHLVAFGTAEPEADRARIEKAGFRPLEPVALQRDIDTPAGVETARFTVVRVPPGAMAEGRIQYCRHHTPRLLWQDRWLAHANQVRALAAVLLCVQDPQEAAQRYARFTGLLPQIAGGLWRIDTARGRLLFLEPSQCERRFGVVPPSLPWIAGYALASGSVSATRRHMLAAGVHVTELDGERCFIRLPPELGGLIVFEPPRGRALTL
jgi:hypothetical protein